jgi:hypothetical protein
MLRPLTSANEITDNIVSLLESGLQYSLDDVPLTKLEHRAKQLSKANIAEGYVALAAISMLRGEFDEMRSRYEIARNQGLGPGQQLNYATTLCHAGFFSEAAPIVSKVADSLPDPYFSSVKAAMCFQFQVSIAMFDKANREKLAAPADFASFITDIKTIASVGIDDATLVKLADLAGEVMREHKVFFKIMPLLSFCPTSEGDMYVVVAYPVPVSFEDASEMTISFAQKMFSKGMNSENLLIRFRGEYELNA